MSFRIKTKVESEDELKNRDFMRKKVLIFSLMCMSFNFVFGMNFKKNYFVDKEKLCGLLNWKQREQNKSTIVKREKNEKWNFEVITYKNPIFEKCKKRIIIPKNNSCYFETLLKECEKIVGKSEVVIDCFRKITTRYMTSMITSLKPVELIIWDYEDLSFPSLPDKIAIKKITWKTTFQDYSCSEKEYTNFLEKNKLKFENNLYYFPNKHFLARKWCGDKKVCLDNIKKDLTKHLKFAKERINDIPKEYHKDSALLQLIKKEIITTSQNPKYYL